MEKETSVSDRIVVIFSTNDRLERKNMDHRMITRAQLPGFVFVSASLCFTAFLVYSFCHAETCNQHQRSGSKKCGIDDALSCNRFTNNEDCVGAEGYYAIDGADNGSYYPSSVYTGVKLDHAFVVGYVPCYTVKKCQVTLLGCAGGEAAQEPDPNNPGGTRDVTRGFDIYGTRTCSYE